MNQGNLAIGMVSGLFVALLFVAGASAVGPSLLHIDLVPKASSMNAPSGASDQTGQSITNVAPSLTQAPSFHASAVDSLSADGAPTLALLFVPVILGIAGGLVLYALWARRVDAE